VLSVCSVPCVHAVILWFLMVRSVLKDFPGALLELTIIEFLRL
jgi:hypothetical protein